MKAWKLNALVAAMALCAAAGGSWAAGTQKSAADTSSTTATTPSTSSTDTTMSTPSTSSTTSANAGNKDAQAACEGLTGTQRSDCLRENLNRGSNAECGNLTGTARSDCLRNSRLKSGAAPSAGGSPGAVDATTNPSGGVGGGGNVNPIKMPAAK